MAIEDEAVDPLEQARRRLEAARQSQQQQVEPEEQPDEVTEPVAVPPSQADRRGQRNVRAEEEAPALAQAKERLASAREDAGLPEQNESIIGDIGTDLKIGASQLVTGPMIRGETNVGLREITRNRVAEQIPEADLAGIEELAGKKVENMEFRELDYAADKFYGTTKEEGDWLFRSIWAQKKREMMGFREGDKHTPSGTPYFPEAQALISGSMRSGAFNPMSLTSLYENIARPIMRNEGVDTRQQADETAKTIADMYEEYSAKGRAEADKPFLDEDATANPLTWFSEDTKGLRGVFHATMQQGPMLLAMAASARVGGRIGARESVRRGMTPTSTFEEIQNLQKRGARIGGAVAGGATEMALIRDAVFSESHNRIYRESKDSDWNQNEDYLNLIDGGLLPDEAKQIVSYSYANSAGEMAMVISGALLGTPMGAFYGGLTGQSAGRQAAKESILKQMGKASALETGQEMAQEGFEQIASNLAVMRVDTDLTPFDGVAEAMAGAAFTSAPYGALSGIRSDKGSGLAKEKDDAIRAMQPWVNAANERWKFQNKKGPNTSFAQDASPQDQLKAMLELERLQEKEANEFLQVRTQTRELIEKSGASKERLLEFDSRERGYQMDLAMIAQRKKARVTARRQAQLEQQAMAERKAAKDQVERDVLTISDNNRLVENLQAIQNGELLTEEQYAEINQMGYGKFNPAGTEFMLTQRGVTARKELAAQAVELRDKLDAGVGSERREDRALREAYQNLTEQEFEDQVMRDDDTKLWNKRKWNQDKADAGPVAVIDADALKWVNDNMSHSAGTQMLRMIAAELNAIPGAQAYRYGGDEFIVTHPDPDKLQAAVESAISRINALPRLEEAGKSVKVQVSAGYGENFDDADAALNTEKRARIQRGERVDTRVEGASPPSLQLSGPEESGQMRLFAMGENPEKFNDDLINDPANEFSPEDWDEYVSIGGDYKFNAQLFDNKRVSDEEMGWIEEMVERVLPSTNRNNPPITLLHDYTWLSEVSPNQYDELKDMGFSAANIRGMFSMDDPTHGVFLFADAIMAASRAKTKRGMRTVGWSSLKYRIANNDIVEVIDGDGKIKTGRVVSFRKAPPMFATTPSAAEKRLTDRAIKARQRLTKLADKEQSLLRQKERMSPQKQADKDHPINKQLVKNFEQQNQAEKEIRSMQSQMLKERQNRWNKKPDTANDLPDNIVVEIDGEIITFDPNANRVMRNKEEDVGQTAEPDLTLGRFKHGKGKVWYDNLGNEEAAKDEPVTRELVQQVAADTVLHETVGHFGIRGITQDYESYIKLTHAVVDSFPEVANELRAIGYNFRTDINKGDDLQRANKALLGEEIIAWVAGEKLAGRDGMNLEQRNLFDRVMFWIKSQLIKSGWGKYFRNRQAAKIRSARRALQKAKTKEQRKEAFEKLYGANGITGLVHVGMSGVRTGGWQTPSGKVVKSAGGPFDDNDLLSIVRASYDYIQNGNRGTWKFKDAQGKQHNVYMRDLEIFRKPIYDVMINGVRGRTEDEIIYPADEAEPPPVPSMAEAYKEATGKDMPEGWKPLTPADFKDEAKEAAARMLEGKSKEEVKQIKADRLLPTPKTLFDEATENMSEEERGLAGRVQSIIAQAKKEKQRVENALKSKKATIANLERTYGVKAVERDQIPIFPEVASIQGFMEAAKAALPSSSSKGHITQMEMEAAGFEERIWPSRAKQWLEEQFGSASNGTILMNVASERLGISEKRLNELTKPFTQMTEKEAQAFIDYMVESDKSIAAAGMAPEFTPNMMDARAIAANNALNIGALVPYFEGYTMSGQSPETLALINLFGEDSSVVSDYNDARAMMMSSDPDLVADGIEKAREIMHKPLDVVRTQLPKDWVASRIETPVYQVSVTARKAIAQLEARDIYKTLYGKDYPSHRSLTAAESKAIQDYQRADILYGPDVGYHPNLGRWVEAKSDREMLDYYPSLTPMWTIPEEYRGAAFWQSPAGNAYTHHMGESQRLGAGRSSEQGIWGHTRYSENYDGDPNAPTAPNPAKQGRAMTFIESQADMIQDASKKYESEELEKAALKQRERDGLALTLSAQNYLGLTMDLVMENFSTSLQDAKSNIDEDDIRDKFGADVYDNATLDEQAVMEELTAMNPALLAKFGVARDEFNQLQRELRTGARNIVRAANRYKSQDSDKFLETGEVDQKDPTEIAFVGDARMFEWNDQRAMQDITTELYRYFDSTMDVLNDLRSLGYRSDPDSAFQKLVRVKSIENFRQAEFTEASLNPKRNEQRFRDSIAMPNRNNQPGHRIGYMKSLAVDVLDRIEIAVTGRDADPDMKDELAKLFDEEMDITTSQLIIDMAELGRETGIDVPDLYSAISSLNMADTPALRNLKIQVKLGGNDSATVTFVGKKSDMTDAQPQVMDSIRDFVIASIIEGGDFKTRQRITGQKDRLDQKWDYGGRQAQHWVEDFNIREAYVTLTEDPDNPMVVAHPELGGLTVSEANQMQAENNIEDFSAYANRKWATLWDAADATARAEIEANGGNETTPTTQMWEKYASAWNDSPPFVMFFEVPKDTNADGELSTTDKAQWRAIRPVVGDDVVIQSKDPHAEDKWNTEYTPNNYTSLSEKLTLFISDIFVNYGVSMTNDATKNSLKGRQELLAKVRRRVAELEAQLGANSQQKKEDFNNGWNKYIEDAPYEVSSMGDISQVFERLISAEKKGGYQKRNLIERNEQWRVAQALWALTEAVRNGYSRIHLPKGHESGSRGGFMRTATSAAEVVHSANEIDFSLEKITIRGKQRDVVIIKADTVDEPVWFDVTADNLYPLNTDRQLKAEDVGDGYFSPELTKHLGRPVAEKIAEKLHGSANASKTKTLLISQSSPRKRGGQTTAFGSYVLHDTQGNVIYTAPSMQEAEAERERIYNGEKTAQPRGATTRGKVTRQELGGPIQFVKTAYFSSGQYHLEDGDNYQHTFAQPTLAGGLANYDLKILGVLNGHLARFGLKVEEGVATIPDKTNTKHILFAGGNKVSYRVPESIEQQYPNIGIDELTGENFGYMINSDNGPVINNVYLSRDDAEAVLNSWMLSSEVNAEGQVGVYQITINDELRRFHEQPQNPFLGTSAQVQGNEKLSSAIAKIGSNAPTLLDRFNQWKQTWKASVNTGMFDRFYGILHALNMTGSSTLGYKLTRMTTGLDSIMKGVFEFGHPVWRSNVIANEGRGLLKILEPVSDNVELWAGYMAGVRANRLLLEGYDKLPADVKARLDRAAGLFDGDMMEMMAFAETMVDGQTGEKESAVTSVKKDIEMLINNGRERLFTPAEIVQLKELGNTFPVFKQVAADYAMFNNKMLDFAEESGIINPETRPLWEEADYIPFYRIADDRLVGPLAKTAGIANQNSPIQTLKGGSAQLGDLVHNIFMNATKLMDASIKNHAALTVVDELEPTGLIRKEKHSLSKQLIPMDEIKRVLKKNNIDLDDLEEEVQAGLQVMFAIAPPQGDGVISLMRNGQKEYYKTEDELLYRSMAAVNMDYFNRILMSPARFAKTGLTTMITLDPGFMAANYIRDSLSTFVIGRDTMVPMLAGVSGFKEAITEGDTFQAMVASGASFESGYINQGDPKSTHRYIKARMKDAGFQRTLLGWSSPRKLFNGWKRFGSAVENANRVAVYRAAKRAGKSELDALFESKDIMDFSMGGDYKVVQFLIQTVPFMGARMQGLHRLGRGAAENPVAFTLKGGLVGLAGMALWLKYRDDPRYEELEEWEKDTYFHFWVGDQHWRLPKGFEVGAIFNTIPERIMEYYYSQETDAGKLLMNRMGHMFIETFNMNPIPQVIKPLTEMAMNKNSFTGRAIESPYEKNLLPEDRYKYYTSETFRQLTALFPEGINTKWYGVIKSPKQLENAWNSYTGTIGRYILNASDIAMREMFDYPTPPAWNATDLPVLSRFMRGDRPRRTKYEQTFYDELQKTIIIMNSLNMADNPENPNDERYEEIEAFYKPYIDAAQDFRNFSREMSENNKEARAVYLDPNLTAEQKRAEINDLQRERTRIAKEAYELRPSAVKEGLDARLDTLIDNFEIGAPSTEMRAELPRTSELFENLSALSPAQLEKLAKAVNYKPEPEPEPEKMTMNQPE